MLFKNLLPLALAAAASAQNLTAVIAANNATLSTLSSLLATQPGIVSAITSATNITILAPSNAALAKFLNSSAGALAAADSSAVAALLSYHVLVGSYPASAFSATPQFIPTLLTNTTYANVTGGQRVEVATNGSSVVFTSGLLAKSTVTTANLKFTGGIIHVIDTVLTVPQSDSATAVGAGLTSLAGALTKTNLVSTVNGLKDVTIFAPTNAAFAAIGNLAGNLTTEQLTGILEYHVVQGTVGYSTLLSNTTLKTVAGGNVMITVENGMVFVNSAKVVIPNVLVANGVVHVIDNVLNPAATSGPTNPTATPTAAYSGASSMSAAPFTSSMPAPSGTASSASSGSSTSAASTPTMSASAAVANKGATFVGGLVAAGMVLFAAAL